MYLSKLSIEGYKNFLEKFEITFAQGLNVLVGENAVGKSAIVDAIRLLLPEDEFGRKSISDFDFHRPFKKSKDRSKSFRIKGIFEELSKEELIAFLPWNVEDKHASLTFHADNKTNQRGHYKWVRWGGASRSSIFETDLFDTINCIYLPPLRDAEAKLREGKGSRLARLLKNLNKVQLKSGDTHPLEDKVKKFNEELAEDEDETIFKANKLISSRMEEAMGSIFGQETLIQFSEINFNRIVESLRLFFFPKSKLPKHEICSEALRKTVSVTIIFCIWQQYLQNLPAHLVMMNYQVIKNT